MCGLFFCGCYCLNIVGCEFIVMGYFKVIGDGSIEFGMVVFDSEQIVVIFFDDFFSN